MADDLWLFVGLGNPGSKYQNHRHNVGFMAVDEIIRRFSFGTGQKKYKGECFQGSIEGQKVFVLKPQTYMNESGQSVQAAAAFFKIKPDRIVVFYDELDLVPGKVRMKKGGGAGGHNGIRSIDKHLGKNYWRVRIGIGHPGDKARVTGYVLGNFSSDDQKWLEKTIPALAEEVPHLLNNEMEKYMTKVAHLTQPQKPKKKVTKEICDEE